MKKRYFGLPLPYYLAIFSFSLVLILFGSFFDYKLSKALVDQKDAIGLFIETMGQVFGFATIPFGAVLVFKSMNKKEGIGFKILGWALFLIALIMSVYNLGGAMCIKEGSGYYGYRFTPVVAYLISVLLNAVLFVTAFLVLKNEYSKEMFFLGLIFLLGELLQWLIVKLFKHIGCRPRYRFLLSEEGIANNVVFRSWWEFQPFKYSGDNYYSWPSGHSASIAQVLMFPAIIPFLKYPFKNEKVTFYSLAIALALLVPYFRIRVGAHYLSDVGFGLLFGSLIDFALLALFSLNPKKKEEKEEKNKAKNANIFSKKEGRKQA